MDIGRIEALALRASLAAPPARADGVRAIAGLGLDGDVHADPLSPRQLLLAGTDATTRSRCRRMRCAKTCWSISTRRGSPPAPCCRSANTSCCA